MNSTSIRPQIVILDYGPGNGFCPTFSGCCAMNALTTKGLSPSRCIWYVQYRGFGGQFVFAEDCAGALMAADRVFNATTRPRVQSVKKVLYA